MQIASIDAGMRELHAALARLLLEPVEPPLWDARLRAISSRLAEWADDAADALLYLLLHGAARTLDRYSSHHALVCAGTAAVCATALQWPEPERRALLLGALTMNIGMTALQDDLTFRERTPTLDQRRAIDHHAERGAAVLRAGGIDDALWLGVVQRHHQALDPALPDDAADTAARLADLLHRIDVFTAKMSPRQARKGMPPAQAVLGALGRGGTPDRVGASIVRAVGMFPLGSFVKLANGEVAIVVRRGRRADKPVVASFRGANRQPLPTPLRRDTTVDIWRITSFARPEDAGMLPDILRLYALGD